MQTDPNEMRAVLAPYFVERPDLFDRFLMGPMTMAAFQNLPVLRGLWTGGSQHHTGGAGGVWEIVDISGGAHHLTIGGDPQHSVGGTTRQPFMAFDGTGDYGLYLAGEPQFDISGTETSVGTNKRGLTIGAWVLFNNAASASEYIISKRLASSQRAYWLFRNASGKAAFGISSDGSAGATDTISSSSVVVEDEWHFIVGRFDPSTSVDVFLNGEFNTNTATIESSIHNTSTADLYLGGNDPAASLITGYISMAFICACYIDDYTLLRLYEISRLAYGVS